MPRGWSNGLDSLDSLALTEYPPGYSRTVEQMISDKVWYGLKGMYKGRFDRAENRGAGFQLLPLPRHVGLGRSTFYDIFLEDLSRVFGHPVYQGDYLVWVDPFDPYVSLGYYIDTAERIEFSLRGIPVDDVHGVVQFGKLASGRSELGTPYMTLWEINQILFSENVDKTWWHVAPEQDTDDVRSALEGIVKPERVISYDPST